MATLTLHQLTDTDIQEIANTVKDALLETLELNGHLNGTAEDLGGRYVVTVMKQGWFGKLFDKFAGTAKDVPQFVILENTKPREVAKED